MYLSKEKLAPIIKRWAEEKKITRYEKAEITRACMKAGAKLGPSSWARAMNGLYSISGDCLKILCSILGVKKEDIL